MLSRNERESTSLRKIQQMAAQRADSGDISLNVVPTGINSFGSWDEPLSRPPFSKQTHTVAQHPRLREDTERARTTKARIPAPADASIDVKSKDSGFLPGPNGDVATNVFGVSSLSDTLSDLTMSRNSSDPTASRNSNDLTASRNSSDLTASRNSSDLTASRNSSDLTASRNSSDLTASRNSSIDTRAVGSEWRNCAVCKKGAPHSNQPYPVHCFIAGKRSSKPKNIYKVYTCVDCRTDTSTCPNYEEHGDLQWVWKADPKSPPRSQSGRWQMKCSKCLELRKCSSKSRKGGVRGAVSSTQVAKDEDVVQEMLRRNAFGHLSTDLKNQIMAQIDASLPKGVGPSTSKLTVEWTRCNYCKARYKHNSGIKNRHTAEKCIVFKARCGVVRSSPDASSHT